MKIYEIINILETWAPPSLQEGYDNSGLITGNRNLEFQKAIICLDCLEEVVDEAIQDGANLIISHHPIVFSGLKKLTGSNYIERVVIKAIKHDIAIYAIHTNLDHVISGVSAEMANRIGLKNIKILREKADTLFKLTTFVPTQQQEALRNALFVAGAGHIGNYDSCSFNSPGTGTFRAGKHANPFVGKIGEVHSEEEIRMELIVPEWKKSAVTTALFQNHPYEEVAYYWTRLENSNQEAGAGVIGSLPQPMEFGLLLNHLKAVFGGMIRYTNAPTSQIQTIALCGGSGSFLIADAIHAGADLYLSADIKYHQFFDADGKIALVDIGHYESEQFTQDLILRFLNENFNNFAARLTAVKTNPINYL
jgi:dinuclear metal center YbgI/SA1388 family protein